MFHSDGSPLASGGDDRWCIFDLDYIPKLIWQCPSTNVLVFTIPLSYDQGQVCPGRSWGLSDSRSYHSEHLLLKNLPKTLDILVHNAEEITTLRHIEVEMSRPIHQHNE